MRDYDRIRRAIEYLETHGDAQPELEAVARAVGLSPHHFQRLFRRWAGISPKRFLQALTLEHAKRLLAESQSVLDTALTAGLSGPGRLHDLFVTLDAMTPGEFKGRGRDLAFEHGIVETPFGLCFMAATARGLHRMAFLDTKEEAAVLVDELHCRWPAAAVTPVPARAAALADSIFGDGGEITLHVRGTNFQIQVWRALLSIPPGRIVSYGDLARVVKSGPRATAQAVAGNPVAFLVPCHRVIRGTGAMGGYRWGVPRKRALLAWESAQIEETALVSSSP